MPDELLWDCNLLSDEPLVDAIKLISKPKLCSKIL